MTTLISFLGRGQSGQTAGYRTASYRFSPSFVREVPFFGLALCEYLKPRRLILAGTAGSMWDVFFQQQGAPGEDVRALTSAVQNECVDGAMLTAHEKLLSRKLGLPVQCLLIPYARDDGEQITVLRCLAQAVPRGETIALDVTHGFRHLPMLALVAARYLVHAASVKIDAIHYGALEMKSPSGEVPVLRLDGLLKILDWVEALATYDKDGDYGVFGKLLEDDGLAPGMARQLEKASYFERTSNPAKAREALAGENGAAAAVENHDGELSALFKDTLMERIQWFRRPARDQWELALADAYRERRDYLRASLFLFEACVTHVAIGLGKNIGSLDARKESLRIARTLTPDIKTLEYLRNNFAHGVMPDEDEDTPRLLASEGRLAKRLRQIQDSLFSSSQR